MARLTAPPRDRVMISFKEIRPKSLKDFVDLREQSLCANAKIVKKSLKTAC